MDIKNEEKEGTMIAWANREVAIACVNERKGSEDGDGWAEWRKDKGYVSYQNKRMGSLFKHVYDDGRVVYSDVDASY